MEDKSSAPSLLSFGSYRLGVHTPDADVDCLVLAPPHATRDDFFDSWVDVLKGEERVTELHPVASAYTPVIKFQMDGISIDLIFARTNNSKWLTEQRMKMTQPPLTDEDGQIEERVEMNVDDSLLVGLDETSVRSVNGVRVAQFLLDTFDGDHTRMNNFRLTLRAVKEWARVHGLYANVLGFLGGVNWAILVDLISQQNPDASASKLLHIFFATFANWEWPQPVLLSNENYPPEAPDGVKPLPIWDPNANYRDSKHMMPIITPCYPPMNSSYNVGEPQLRRLRDELGRASKLCEAVLAGQKTWDVLFKGNDFFKQHANYLQVNIIGTNEDEFRSWLGICEARMRLLIAGLESPSAGVNAYPFAKFFQRQDGDKYVSSFFIALRFARSRTAKRVKLGPLVTEYLQVVNSFEGRGSGMDLTIHLVSKSDLPSFVFVPDDVKCHGGVETIARTPLKANRNGNGVSNKNADESAKTPLPSSSKKRTLDEAEISPCSHSFLKQTAIQ